MSKLTQTESYLMNLAREMAEAIALQSPVISLQGKNTMEVISEFALMYVPSLAEVGNEEIDTAVERWLMSVMMQAKELDASLVEENPYLQYVHFNTKQSGPWTLTNAAYEAGEILQYDFPKKEGNVLIPRIGYFTERVSFPTVYENSIPWMSVIPSEIMTMRKPIRDAHGNILVLGLGLGYYAFMAALKEEVSHVTVVEMSTEVIRLFEENIRPCFPKEVSEKIEIVKADAFGFMDGVEDESFDFVFADIWEGEADGHIAWEKLHMHEERLENTEFAYWIEEYIH